MLCAFSFSYSPANKIGESDNYYNTNMLFFIEYALFVIWLTLFDFDENLFTGFKESSTFPPRDDVYKSNLETHTCGR